MIIVFPLTHTVVYMQIIKVLREYVIKEDHAGMWVRKFTGWEGTADKVVKSFQLRWWPHSPDASNLTAGWVHNLNTCGLLRTPQSPKTWSYFSQYPRPRNLWTEKQGLHMTLHQCNQILHQALCRYLRESAPVQLQKLIDIRMYIYVYLMGH